MTVEQIATILNTINAEVAEGAALVNEDLTNVVDIGTTVFSATWKDNYVKSMIDQIGKMVFVDRPYAGYAPSILRSAWEYGSILAKVRAKDFDAKQNPSWQLTAGQTVNQFEYNPPEIKQTFWNHKEAWQIDCSFAEEQVKSAFASASQLNAFFSMIESTIDNSRTQKMDNLVMRTINRLIATTINTAGAQVIPLLTLYNADFAPATPLTAARAHTDPQFLRYLAFTMLDVKDRLKVRTTVYNQGGAGYPTYTPDADLHVVINSLYGRAMDVFMQADTFHDDLTRVGSYETVPFWQGSGASYAVADRTKIDVTIGSDTVSQSYIVGVMFDEDAAAINNNNMRVTSAYNANGEYYNNFYKVETSCMNDIGENVVVFTLT